MIVILSFVGVCFWAGLFAGASVRTSRRVFKSLFSGLE